jgi:SNF2 family DNA or RNA helicase
MDIPTFGEENKAPTFLNLDDEICKLVEDVQGHQSKLGEIEFKYATKHNEILAKIEALREALVENNIKQTEARKKAKEQFDNDLSRLAALRKQKAEEEANKAFETTVALIKEICEDFASWKEAREYQVEDVVRIVHQYIIGSTGVLNANEMALGKTFETLVSLYICSELHRRKFNTEPKVLWLTKVSIVETGGTLSEAKRWFPNLKMFPAKGSNSKASKDLIMRMVNRGGICLLTNYEFVKTTPKVNEVQWDFVIMDEVHKLKGGANSSPTAIWSAVKELNIGFMMMLTGTPLVNRVEEIWSYLHLFDPMAFPDSRSFSRQFSALRDLSGKLQFSLRSENMLKDILKGRLIRRTAKEVGLQMPPVTEIITVLPHNLEQGDLYQKMKTEFFIWLDQQEGKALSATSILAQLTRLRQINVLPVANFQIKDQEGNVIETLKLDCRDSSKLDEAMDIISQTQDQALVFCSFNEPLEEMAFRLQIEGLRGEVISSAHRNEMSKYEIGFQNKEIDVLLINSAMGEGMNLHKDNAKWEGGARAVILLDKWWNDSRNRQCIARAVRPGENSGEPVFVYDLKCDGSVDFFIQALCDEKSAQFDNLTEASELRPSGEWKTYLQGLL